MEKESETGNQMIDKKIGQEEMYMKKRILCFGDSNTWGYIPESGERYEEEIRWTGVLARELGTDWRVIEEGLSGRTTVFSDLMEPERCGILQVLPVILSQLPFDYMIVMLGTNDTKSHFHVNSREMGYAMEELIIKIRQILEVRKSAAKVILAAPAPIKAPTDEMFNEESVKKSQEAAAMYREVAEQWGCLFFDAGTVVKELGADGIHFTEAGHEALGKAFAEFVREQESE